MLPQKNNKQSRNTIKNLISSFKPKMNLTTNKEALIKKTEKQNEDKKEEETFSQMVNINISPPSKSTDEGDFINKLKMTLENKAFVYLHGNKKLMTEKLRAFEATGSSRNKELHATMEEDIRSNIKEKLRIKRTEGLFKNYRPHASSKKIMKAITSRFSHLKGDSSRVAKNDIAILDQLRSISRLAYFIGSTYDMISNLKYEKTRYQ